MGFITRLKAKAADKQDRFRHKYTRGRRPSVYANTYDFPIPSSSSSSSPHFSFTSSLRESISPANSTTTKKDPWYRRLWKKASFASRRNSAAASAASVQFVSDVVELRPRRAERWPLE